ncbi:MAG TPA: zinc-dependent metalloprotease family protein, partial [Saprospiraceae bacterium]|nr:zinc-dependent metalloprotease family protein [Saprospiraceae bacterium]
VWQAPVMHPDLAARYPQIRTFMGRGLASRHLIVRMDYTPAGFHAMLLGSPGGSVFIEPYARGNTEAYTCYFKKDHPRETPFVCGTHALKGDTLAEPLAQKEAGDCGKLRKYRLALACTGEYAQFHGAVTGNRAPALAAMVTSMNRVNGVFERDASVRMIIVPNDSLIIYTNPATDPYTNNDGPTMLGENQTTCDNVIGSANYDVGHVFSTGGGGIAQLSSPCSSANKAKGVTGRASPVGDYFDIDYVAHEMGHQFAANHTQYNDCNRNNPTAVEPGSASSIMGYAGICAPNVQAHSDDYFHSSSLIEIGSFVTGTGNGCATIQNNGNTAPTISSATASVTIPKGTPFVLNATATDAQNDALSYCWEQRDNTGNATQPPLSTNTQGPMFRSYLPVNVGSRYFPKFEDVLSGYDEPWEELPSVGRSLRMRIMVRDNRANGGCTTNQNMTVTVNGSAGPFKVTKPNTAITIAPGATDTIKWDVAGTAAAPINCANVDLLISTDGGASFSNLVSGTPNDGVEVVTFPNLYSEHCRVMVRSVGSIFYDVSNVDFVLGVLQVYCNQVYNSGDVPKPIADNATTTSTLSLSTVPSTINDLNVINLSGTHTWVNDLSISLESPGGTERILLDQVCDDEDDFGLNFDDEASNSYSSIPCPPVGNGSYRPFQTLSPFDGQNPNGTWTLRIVDHNADDAGTLNSWGLNLCILSSSPPAPVELQDFSVRMAEGVAQLHWSTATERSNRGFHIERSVGHTLAFRDIGWVEGNGNSTLGHAYAYADADLQAGQTHYYRLRQEDFDGSTEYSPVRSLSVGTHAGQLHLYPSPARDLVQVELPPDWPEEMAHFSLCNASGHRVSEQRLWPGQPLDLSTLPPGVYWVSLVSAEQLWRGKVVKAGR